jgi:hypothetical protein
MVLSNLIGDDAHLADKAARWLVVMAESGLEKMIDDLFREAFLIWTQRSFERCSDDEICCTVIFFDCCENVLDSWESVMRIVYEGAQPTREMRMGRAHPNSVGKPDLTLLFGPFTIRIEAKRLKLGQGLPREYVQEGMRRFIDRKYSSSQGRPGYMLGYIILDEISEIVGAINARIESENDLSESDILGPLEEPYPRFKIYSSKHAPDLRIIHNMFDLRTSVALFYSPYPDGFKLFTTCGPGGSRSRPSC